jgi:nucleoside-diphosphate-sugar epimerase
MNSTACGPGSCVMPNEILVTGASGFVGRRLVSRLRGQGEAVREFSECDGNIAHAPIHFPEVSQVVHLAARTYVPDSWRDPRAFFETNVLGLVNVLDFCVRQKAALVLLSSYVYGHPRSLPIAEHHPLEAFNPYSLTKILAEQTAAFYRDKHGLAVTIVRPFNLYGPGQADHFLIPMLIRQALDPSRESYEVEDDGPRRDYLSVEDLIDLVLACRNRPGGVYNAGSGRSVSIGELAALINQAAGVEKAVRSRGRRRPEEVMDVVADIRHAEAELGWRPRVTLKEGLAAIVAALRA